MFCTMVSKRDKMSGGESKGWLGPSSFALHESYGLAAKPRHRIGNEPISNRFSQGLLVAGRTRGCIVGPNVILWVWIVHDCTGLLLVKRAGRCEETLKPTASGGGQHCDRESRTQQESFSIASHDRESFRVKRGGEIREYEVSRAGTKRNPLLVAARIVPRSRSRSPLDIVLSVGISQVPHETRGQNVSHEFRLPESFVSRWQVHLHDRAAFCR